MNFEYVIILGVFNALWITGVWNAALPGQILDPIATWMAGDGHALPPIKGWAPDYLNKPLMTCPMCMASIHGTLWYFLFQMGPWYIWPFYVVCLSGLMKVVTILILNKDS
jgi:hypothetical protein